MFDALLAASAKPLIDEMREALRALLQEQQRTNQLLTELITLQKENRHE